jgi:hypothetical protein
MSWWKDAVTVVSPALAAAAAGASWVSVVQSRRALNQTVRPNLQIQPLAMGRVGMPPDEPRQVMYVIRNVGGMAKGTACVLVCGEEYVADFIGFGFIGPQDAYTLRTAMTTTDLQPPTMGVVVCHDMNDHSYVWDVRGGTPQRLKLDPSKPPSLTEMFHRLYPDINLKNLRHVQMGAERTLQPM